MGSTAGPNVVVKSVSHVPGLEPQSSSP